MKERTFEPLEFHTWVVCKVDNAIHHINLTLFGELCGLLCQHLSDG